MFYHKRFQNLFFEQGLELHRILGQKLKDIRVFVSKISPPSKIPPLVLAYLAGEASPASTWVWREAPNSHASESS